MEELQQQLHDWRMEQFPNSEAQTLLIGALQELGEISEIETKEGFDYPEFQGDNTEHKMKEIGDVLVYLSGYCELNDLDMLECYEHAAEEVLTREWH